MRTFAPEQEDQVAPGRRFFHDIKMCRSVTLGSARCLQLHFLLKVSDGVELTRLPQQDGTEEERSAPESGQTESLHVDKRRTLLVFSWI